MTPLAFYNIDFTDFSAVLQFLTVALEDCHLQLASRQMVHVLILFD